MNTANLNNVNAVSASTDAMKGTYSSLYNGTTNYLDISSGLFNINSRSFSICCWFKPAAINIANWIASFGTTTGAERILAIGYRAINAITLGFNTYDLDTTTTFPQDLNTWTFLCFTFNTTIRLQSTYKNGAFVQSRTSIAQLQTVERSMRIKRFRLAIGYANGRIDDFRVYMDKVFTQDEINELYKGRFVFYQDDISEASGGGGGGGNALSIDNQTGAVEGTPFNATYSKLNPGLNCGVSNGVFFGGDGGSANLYGPFSTNISGVLTDYGSGGLGATSTSTPRQSSLLTFGGGGDCNGGAARKGTLIFKFSAVYLTKFLEYTNWYKLFKINVG